MSTLLNKASAYVPSTLINLMDTAVSMGTNYINSLTVWDAIPAVQQVGSIMDKIDQYNNLLVEAKDAIIFIEKINQWAVPIVHQKLYPCKKTWDEFTYTLLECTKYLEGTYMNPNSKFFKTLLNYSNMTREIYAKVSDPSISEKARKEKLNTFVKSAMSTFNLAYYPNYYRQELAFRMLRVVELMEAVKLDIEINKLNESQKCSNIEAKLHHLNAPARMTHEDIKNTMKMLNTMPKKIGGSLKKRKSQRRK